MPALDPASQAALIGAVLLLLSLLWVRRRQAGAPRQPFDDRLDTVAAWPPQVVRVMTLPERRAYDLLRKSLPRNHLLLSQVPLGRFISVPPTHPHDDWMRRVGRMSADLLVCDRSSRVLAVIEVRSADETERARVRHDRMLRVLKSAGLPVHVWHADHLPTPGEVRRLFMPAEAAEALDMDRTGRTRLPVPEIEEMLSLGERTSWGHEGDPVPSAYFDDLDALPAARH